MLILSAEAWQVHRQLWEGHGDELAPDVSRRLEMASMLDPEEVAGAWEVARAWSGQLDRVLGTVDLLALPVIGEAPPTLDNGDRLGQIRYVAPFNLAGTPALSQPLDAGGRLPAALQLAGPARGEELILATAAVIEELSGWPGGSAPVRRPPAGRP
jgi:Asp-tRNA(Asn)/Glu-tRNA(Gln) amidotransferase A subunit family amidase